MLVVSCSHMRHACATRAVVVRCLPCIPRQPTLACSALGAYPAHRAAAAAADSSVSQTFAARGLEPWTGYGKGIEHVRCFFEGLQCALACPHPLPSGRACCCPDKLHCSLQPCEGTQQWWHIITLLIPSMRAHCTALQHEGHLFLLPLC